VRHHLYPIRTEAAELTEDLRATCLRAMSALVLDLAVIDLVEGPDGPVIIEVNSGISSWERLEGTEHDRTESGITRRIADHLSGLLTSDHA